MACVLLIACISVPARAEAPDQGREQMLKAWLPGLLKAPNAGITGARLLTNPGRLSIAFGGLCAESGFLPPFRRLVAEMFPLLSQPPGNS